MFGDENIIELKVDDSNIKRAGWHLPSSIVWNYIDSYRYNIGCSSFYCGWRWYQRFILIVFGHFRPPRNNIFYIFITWVIFECVRLISYNGNNPIIKAVPNLPVKSTSIPFPRRVLYPQREGVFLVREYTFFL